MLYAVDRLTARSRIELFSDMPDLKKCASQAVPIREPRKKIRVPGKGAPTGEPGDEKFQEDIEEKSQGSGEAGGLESSQCGLEQESGGPGGWTAVQNTGKRDYLTCISQIHRHFLARWQFRARIMISKGKR